MYYKNKKTCMRVNNFSNYTKMYESRLQECDFFREQNITADDIITPLEDLVNEEFLDYLPFILVLLPNLVYI